MISFGVRSLLLLAVASYLVIPAAADQKITTRQTIDGAHATVETVYIRGERQRLEFRAESLPPGAQADNNVLIEQFDLRRTLQLSPRYKTYADVPMDPAVRPRPVQQAPATRGGEVKVTIDSVDTGERKQVGEFTARHVRLTTRIEAGSGACQQSSVTEVDGWYIDLRTIGAPAQPGAVGFLIAGQSGCRDHFHVQKLGSAPQGYPIEQTSRHTEQGHTTILKTELLESYIPHSIPPSSSCPRAISGPCTRLGDTTSAPSATALSTTGSACCTRSAAGSDPFAAKAESFPLRRKPHPRHLPPE